MTIGDEWDFYPCKVDDAPASIFLNFWYGRNAPLTEAEHLYWCDIEILRPGEHGMGEQADAELLYGIEDAITAATADAGFYYVGRLRNRASWQLTFYARANRESKLRNIVAEVLPSSAARKWQVGSKLDANWSYYFDFLFPNAERRRWMKDLRVIEALQAEGDDLSEERRVDHWAYFASDGSRDSFVEAAKQQGFELQGLDVDQRNERPCSAQVFRVDSVQLEDIHAVVMLLARLAEEFSGIYDGWETYVNKPEI